MANDNTRIYRVTESVAQANAGVIRHLVRASSQAAAIRHIATPRFTAEVATQDELVELAGNGVKVQDATAA